MISCIEAYDGCFKVKMENVNITNDAVDAHDITAEIVKQETVDSDEQEETDQISDDDVYFKTEIDIDETQYETILHQCPHCDYSSSFHCSLQVHIDTQHASNQNNVEKSGSEEQDNETELRKCETCEESFGQLHHSHGTGSTSDTLVNPKQCCVCHKPLMQNYKYFVRTHSEEMKRYECDMCHKSFSRIDCLKHHMQMKSKDRKLPHCCNICDKRFAKGCHLKIHMMRHTGERPFQCEVCKKTFITSAELKIHTRLHTGTKPYQCTLCKKAYVTSDRLQYHMIVHTETKLHECNLCQKLFKYKRSLKCHMMTLHADEEKPS